jgi:hypothetical protein
LDVNSKPNKITFSSSCSVANRPKFLPQNAKVAPQKSQRPRKSAAEFYSELQKMAEKGPNFFEVWFSHKILDTLKKTNGKSTALPDFFPITMPSESLLTSIKPASMGKSVCGRIFSPAAEFFRKSGRKHLTGVGNTEFLLFC